MRDELDEDFIDDLMADAADHSDEQDDERARVELSTRQSCPKIDASRNLFPRVKQVGHKVTFFWLSFK